VCVNVCGNTRARTHTHTHLVARLVTVIAVAVATTKAATASEAAAATVAKRGVGVTILVLLARLRAVARLHPSAGRKKQKLVTHFHRVAGFQRKDRAPLREQVGA
jgi:hypothetical protein